MFCEFSPRMPDAKIEILILELQFLFVFVTARRARVCDCYADYLEKLHRRGNKLILVHSIELPELSLHNASKSLFFIC